MEIQSSEASVKEAATEAFGKGQFKGVAMVTGGSRGIGRAIALQLARDGYDVAFCYRKANEAAEQVEGAIEQLGRKAFAHVCDVSNWEMVQEFMSAAERNLGPFNVVVNCAGIIHDNPLILMKPTEWYSVIDTNLTGVFHVCRSAVFKFMKCRAGCLINIASVSGIYGNPTQTNYSASKAGIIGFSKALAKEVGPYGIRVNVVAPGFIETDMTESLRSKSLDEISKRIPLRRIGGVQEVADVVSFLASHKASYITGQTIQVDGGIVL